MPFINRELSWLEFNQRVLEEAKRPGVPLLERLKFLAITASNLDEFFQVRVGGLTVLRRSGTRKPDIAGFSPAQQISMIRKRVLAFVAQFYTDASYLTCRPEFVADASLFFNAVTGRSKLIRLQKISAAPTHLKARVLELIDAEAQRASSGESALIMAKCNSLQDPDVIEALYRASRAGVEIKLNIRGVCCLQTGSKRYSKNIEVRSIVDRFLEHARLFYFHQGGDPEVYFSSADWMTRNLEKRIELLVPVEDERSKKRLIQILKAAFQDNTNSFEILKDGTSVRIAPEKGQKRFRFQEHLYKEASKAAKARERERATTFTPHRPPTQ